MAESKQTPQNWRRAQKMRKQGLTYYVIADRLDVSCYTIWRWFNREKARKWNRDRQESKNAWDRQQRKPCPECGEGLVWVHRGAPKCRPCTNAERTKRKREVLAQVAALWNEGATQKEIGAAFGRSNGWAAERIFRAREAGFDLPYRHDYGDKAKFQQLRSAA